MRSGGESRAADEANGLADFDALALMHEHTRQMQVHRFVAVRVGNLDHVAFATLTAGKFDAAGADRLHWRSNRGAVICAHVRAEQFQNRMVARLAEVGSDCRRKFERRVEKRTLQRFSVGGVVAGMSGVVMEK